MNRHRGYSLLELVVVIAIFATLCAVLLPAVNKARLSAKRIQAANDLKQLGLAMHQYADANEGRLPLSAGPRSAFYQILPWIDHGNYWADVESGRRRFDDDYEMKKFLDPADPTLATLDLRKGVASYAYNAKVFVGQETTVLPDRVITVRTWPTLTPKTFQDGLSNTIILADHYAFGCDGTQFSWAWTGPTLHTTVGGRKASIRRSSFADTEDLRPDMDAPPTITFQVRPRMEQCDPRVPQTPYSDLVVCLADGSVRGVSPSISTATFWGAVTPSSGEVLGPDW